MYNSLAQVLFTELIFTAALCFGVWRVGNENPGRLGAVSSPHQSKWYLVQIQLAINMLFLCAQSVSIGFHLNGVSSARRSAKEMQAILREAPLIERDMPVEKVGFLVSNPWKKSILPESAQKKLQRRFEASRVGVKEMSKEPLPNRPEGRGAIAFRNVHFSYPSRPDVEVLKGISFELNAGEVEKRENYFWGIFHCSTLQLLAQVVLASRL